MSASNGEINWNMLKDKVDFAIIKLGEGNLDTRDVDMIDPMYFKNIHCAVDCGIAIGGYWVDRTDKADDAWREGLECKGLMDALKDVEFDLPIFFMIDQLGTPEHFAPMFYRPWETDIMLQQGKAFRKGLGDKYTCGFSANINTVLSYVSADDIFDEFDGHHWLRTDAYERFPHSIHQFRKPRNIEGTPFTINEINTSIYGK